MEKMNLTPTRLFRLMVAFLCVAGGVVVAKSLVRAAPGNVPAFFQAVPTTSIVPAPVSFVSTARNLLRNASFEVLDANSPAQWRYQWGSTSSNTNLSAEGIHSGAWGLKFTGGGSGHFGISQPNAKTIANRTYVLSAYVKNVNVPSMKVRLGFWDEAHNQQGPMQQYTLAGTHDWRRISILVQTTGLITDETNLFPLLEVAGLSSGAVYVDDMMLTEGNQLTPFETADAQTSILTAGNGALSVSPIGEIFPNNSGALGTTAHPFTALTLSHASIDGSGNISTSGTISTSGSISLPSLTTNSLIISNGSSLVSLPSGSSGYYLQSNGAGSAPTWVANSAPSVAFGTLTGGTNSGAAMVVGSGGSLTYSGGSAFSGGINASRLLGGTWASPLAIGTTASSSANFSSLALGNASQIQVNQYGEMDIVYNGDTGHLTGQGIVTIDNSNNLGNGLALITNASDSAQGDLVNLSVTNHNFQNAGFHLNYYGNRNAFEVVNNGTNSASNALAVTGNNINDSTVGVIGYELGKGSIKVTHNRPTGGTDSNASGLSIDLKGVGTRAQGVYVDSTETGGTLGDLLRLRNQSIDQFFVDYQGNLTQVGNTTQGAYGTNTTITKYGNTTGDQFFVGTNGAFRVQRSTSNSEAFRVVVNGDTQGRWLGTSDGRMKWGDGTNAQDITLRRGAAGVLWEDGSLVINNSNQALDSVIKGVSDSNLFYADATNNRIGIGLSNPLGALHIAKSSGAATLIINQLGTGDILAASSSGTTKFQIDGSGNMLIGGTTTINSLTYTWPSSFGLSGYVLTNNGSGTLSWAAAPGSTWQVNSGVIAPLNITNDLAIGGTSTGSALFQIFSGTGNATTSGTFTFAGTGATNVIATRNKTNLTLGDSQTGNIGINTLTPQALLHVSGGDILMDNNTTFRMKNSGGGLNPVISYSSSNNLQFYNQASTGLVQIGINNASNTSDIRFFTLNNLERLRINTNGLIGIGSGFTPSALIDARGISGTIPTASFSGQTSKATLVVNQDGVGDLFTASASSQTRFVIDNNGNVKVSGASLCVKQGVGNCAGSVGGTIYATTTSVQSADVAENYVSAQTLQQGSVIAPAHDGNSLSIQATTSEAQSDVIGVVSTNPGVTLNSNAQTDGSHPNMYPVALSGRVPLRVSTKNGTIAVGDYLTTSSIPGVAEKATKAGTVIAKALDAYTGPATQEGLITAFVQTGWADPNPRTDADIISLIQHAILQVSVSFEQSVTFLSSVIFKGALTVNSDTAGSVVVPSGVTRLQVIFPHGFSAAPLISLTPIDVLNGGYGVEQITSTSFVIHFQDAQSGDKKLQWFAVLSGEQIIPKTQILDQVIAPMASPSASPSATPTATTSAQLP